MKGKTLRFASICAAVLLGFGMTACNGDGKALTGGEIIPDSIDRAVKVETLTDYTNDRECWLSIPDSELVINPFDYETNIDADRRQTEYFNRADMSFDIGVLDYSSSPKMVKNVLGVGAKNPYGGYLQAKKGFKNGWQPDRLLYSAEYDSGLVANLYDYFYDENTVVRNIQANGKPFVIWGAYAAGNANFLRLEDETFVYRTADGVIIAVSASSEGGWAFYNSADDFWNGSDPNEQPEQTGIWCFTPKFNDMVSVSLAFGNVGEKTENVIARAKEPYVEDNFVEKAGEREKKWNEMLSRCPQPEEFSFTQEFDRKGIDEETVRKYYYRSFAMVISNVLPANKNFQYRSLSLGKASMWSAGSPENKYSCVWESLYGTQMYAFVDPDIAWELCLGAMSTIPADGNIRGESLPSNKAQTVWICYTAKNDRTKLKECVEPLTRYLNWRYENPRWILGGAHDIEDEKDIDFVAAYLVDLKFMIKICAELGDTEAVSYWKQKSSSMYDQMCGWFFSGDEPVQRYYGNDESTETGTPLWVSKSLWCDALAGDELEKVLDFTVKQYNPDMAFAGFGSVKYDDWAYTLYGLVRNGKADIAADMVQAILRDIPRSGFIGELYNAVWRGTVCEGVRPSLFGAILIIDNVWLMNGFMYHEGGIGAMNLFSRDSGVKGIFLNGVEYSLHMNGARGKYTVTANGKSTDYTIDQGGFAEPV